MSQIRSELGPEALILSDRSRDGMVEVTAALETDEAPALRQHAAPSSGLHDLEPFDPGPVRVPPPQQHRAAAPPPGRALDPRLAVAFAWHGLAPSLAAAIGGGPLAAQCARVFRFTTLPLGRHDSPLLLAGPAGGGKTLSVARLATRLVLAGQPPLVITADGQRAGAVEQLAAFTRLLGLTLVAAATPKILARALERREPGQPVLIDAPGLDPGDPQQAADLQALLAASGASMALVLPCGLDPNEAQDIAALHAALGAIALVATRTDVSRRLGGILCASAIAGIPMAEAGISSSAADGLVQMTAAFLADRLAKGAQPITGTGPAIQAASPAEPSRVLVHAALPLHIAAQRRNTQRN